MHAGVWTGVPSAAGDTPGRSARPVFSCRQKSHFAITPFGASYFGAPNGHAISQYRHPMHRASWWITTPSARFSYARDGHAATHAGRSQ